MDARGNEDEAGVQTAIATVSLSGTLNEKLEAIAKAQFSDELQEARPMLRIGAAG